MYASTYIDLTMKTKYGRRKLSYSRISFQTQMSRRLAINKPAASPSASLPHQGLAYAQLDSTERYVRTERKANDYQDHTLHSHIYAKPDSYIGGLERDPRMEWIFDPTTGKLGYSNVELSEGMIRLVLEILSNGGDNGDSSRRMGVAAGSIDMRMDRQWCSVRTGGEPIPIVPREDKSTPTTCRTVVDHIFGTLLTSSNYDPKVVRMGCGTNGYGAKLVNIFSLEFRVRVGDPKRGQQQESIWANNMTQHVSSVSTPGFRYGPMKDGSGNDVQGWSTAPGTPYTGPSYVEISWRVDFKRFGYQEYPDEAFGLYARYLVDFGLTCKLPVSFNGKSFDSRSIQDYGRLFFSEAECASSIVHYEWGTTDNEAPACIRDLKAAAREKMIASCPNASCIPIVEMCIFDTPDRAVCFSFVNGLMTRDGGVHVNEALKVLSHEILESINSAIMGKAKKGKKVGAEALRIPHLTAGDVKPHVSMIINCRLPDPGYSSQSKTQLSRPKPKILIGPKVLTSIGNWSLTERLYAALDAKMFKTMTKTDGKKRRHITLDKGEDANEAGGPRSQECILYLVEGKSASAYPKKRMVLTPGGKDLSGYYPLKGKPLNVTNAPNNQIAENDEIVAIKQMMGFREGIDYMNQADRATLRYGFILDTVDADTDGKHINLLVLNILDKKWPSILKLGMFGYLMTPAVRLFSGKRVMHRFYSPEEYDLWVQSNPGHGLRVKYYKGLGSSTDADIKDDLDTAPMIICVYDDTASQSLDLAFNRKMSDARKSWIQKWRDVTRISDVVPVALSSLVSRRTVTSMINTDLIDYTIDSLFRAIPSFRDGLKKVQRQALYYILTHWKYGHSREDSMKVARIANAGAELTHYHHGEKSFMDAIIWMAQNFVGTNNLNFFMQEGQFGTRHDGGDDAADGRYSETYPEWWIHLVYSKDLVDLVPRRYVEGKPAEPVWIPCDIPMHVINGANGIGTGHSTFLPWHNPYDVIAWLVDRCNGNENPKALVPWVHGFAGTVTVSGATVNVPVPDVAPAIRKSRLSIARDPVVAQVEEINVMDEMLPNEVLAAEANDDDSNALAPPIIKGSSMKTFGVFRVIATYADGRYDIQVTEIPVGRSIHDYRKWIESLLPDKKITDFRDNSTTDVPNFTIYGFNDVEGPTYKTLKLQKSFGLSNMTLIDDNGYPFHFNNSQQVMESYYQSMIQIYSVLVSERVRIAEDKLVDLELQLKFITLVVEGAIEVFKRSKANIREQMLVHQIPNKYLEKVKLYDCTADEMQEIAALIVSSNTELIRLRKVTPYDLWIPRLYGIHEALRKHKY